MDLELHGRTALVTGGSKGIGFGIAERLAAEGCDLRLVARDAATLQEAKAKLEREHPVKVAIYAANLGNHADLERAYSLLDGVDILVNSAGAVPRGALHEVSAEALRIAFEVKVLGTMNLCREALSRMKAKGAGVIINIIGISGERPNPKSIPTSAVNGALIAFTQAAGAASVDDNVRIVGVNPGLVTTERTAAMSAPGDGIDQLAYRHLLAKLPWGRMAHVVEVADLVAFLASPRASYISGAIFTVDAGQRFRA